MDNRAITVRSDGRDRLYPIDHYVSLREFVTSRAFLEATIESPNRLTFWVNEEPVDDDLLLVPGDVLEFQTTCQKARVTPKDVIKRLRALVDLRFERHGGNHDIWKTGEGRTVVIPRHAREFKTGTLKSIIKQAGLDLSIEEFIGA